MPCPVDGSCYLGEGVGAKPQFLHDVEVVGIRDVHVARLYPMVSQTLKTIQHIVGSRPEWCISSTIYIVDIHHI